MDYANGCHLPEQTRPHRAVPLTAACVQLLPWGSASEAQAQEEREYPALQEGSWPGRRGGASATLEADLAWSYLALRALSKATWASNLLTSLSLSFLICKMGPLVPASQVVVKNK